MNISFYHHHHQFQVRSLTDKLQTAASQRPSVRFAVTNETGSEVEVKLAAASCPPLSLKKKKGEKKNC